MSSAAQVVRRPLSERSIRVLVHPTPITFAERRSVLQVLERFGPVETFRMTPGYHANYISITKEVTSARQLIANSPITYHMSLPRIESHVQSIDLRADSTTSTAQGIRARATATTKDYVMTESPAAPQKDDFAEEERQFTLEIFPAPEYEHKFAMSSSPLGRPWAESCRRDHSFISSILQQLLPQNVQSKGLAHWLFKMVDPDYKEERLQLTRCLPSKMKR